MSELRVLIIILTICVLLLGTGITFLVVRHQQGPPDWYRDAAINYENFQPRSKVTVRVVKGDTEVMLNRIASFVKKNRGTIKYQGKTYMTAIVDTEIARTVSVLNQDANQLSPRYREWPDWTEPLKVAPAHSESRMKVSVRSMPYNKVMLDAGIAMTISGGILTFFSIIILAVVIEERIKERRHD